MMQVVNSPLFLNAPPQWLQRSTVRDFFLFPKVCVPLIKNVLRAIFMFIPILSLKTYVKYIIHLPLGPGVNC